MNDDKTEFIVFGSRKLLPKCVTTNVRVGNGLSVFHALNYYVYTWIKILLSRIILPKSLELPLMQCSI